MFSRYYTELGIPEKLLSFQIGKPMRMNGTLTRFVSMLIIVVKALVLSS